MRYLLPVFLLFFTCTLRAQVPGQPTVSTNANTYDDIGKLWRYEASGGVMVHSNGFGAVYQRGRYLTGYSKRFFEVQVLNYRHSKEVKTENAGFDNKKGYFYGKLNSFFIIRPGIGYQKVIYTKPDQRGVEIRYVAFGGLSLGLAKPIYLLVAQERPSQVGYDVLTVRYDPDKHFTDNIIGRGPFTRGISEISIHPGLYGKLGLNFEYGMLDDKTRALETGICIDAYPQKLPLMANDRNQRVLLSIYLTISYGRKWL